MPGQTEVLQDGFLPIYTLDDQIVPSPYHKIIAVFGGTSARKAHGSMTGIAPSVVVCNLKTQRAKRVRQKYGDQIKDKLWKDSFWSDSYFLTTTGGANVDVLKVYIQQQGIEKPKRKYVRRK